MKLSNTLKLGLILIILGATNVFSQRNFLTYYELNDYLQASPGAFKYGLYGYDNPALLAYSDNTDMMLTMNSLNDNFDTFDNFGFFTRIGSLGFGMVQTTVNGKTIDEYRISKGFGSRKFSLGVGYGWSNGALGSFNRLDDMMYFGALYRPNQYFSLGIQQSFSGSDKQSVFDLAIRPLKNHLLALYADFAMFSDQNISEGQWSAGLSWEVLDGIRINARYFDTKDLKLGIDFSLGGVGFSSATYFDKDFENHGGNIYTIRSGEMDRNIFRQFDPGVDYLKISLSGTMKYQKSSLWGFFSENTNTLYSTLKMIDVAKKDNTIGGLIINTTDMAINMEMVWELREKLKDFKSSGKKVVIYIERAGLSIYHLASVADKIIIDPMGQMSLPGYILGGSYYKNLMEKLGVGIEEFRYFKYKSAVESYSRENMSEGDREQRQAVIDAWYVNTRKDVCEGRGFTEEEFDEIIDGSMLYLSETALEKNMVDTIGRWNSIDEIVRNMMPDVGHIVSYDKIDPAQFATDDYWGEPKKIAVIYAVGVCAMNSGINARALVNSVKSAATDPEIEAIVLRVDSPGGDAMASDYIAEIVRKYKKNKPIIVSQGFVAASGGYWLSMDADKIVSSPYSITGSIGVIGMWMYDKGIKEDLGISTDFVKVGKYADLGFSFSLPYIGIGLPDRNLTEDELAQKEKNIKALYGDFVTKVAEGRNLDEDSVKAIAQGRIWSGSDGKEIGLVDEIGGLTYAIDLAKDMAGIEEDEKVWVYQYYIRGEMSLLPMLMSFFVDPGIQESSEFKMTEFLLENNGLPLPVLPLDYLDCIDTGCDF